METSLEFDQKTATGLNLFLASSLTGPFYVFGTTLFYAYNGSLKGQESSYIYLEAIMSLISVVSILAMAGYAKKKSVLIWPFLIFTFLATAFSAIAGSALICISPFMFKGYFIIDGIFAGFALLCMAIVLSCIYETANGVRRLLIVEEKKKEFIKFADSLF